MRCEVMYPAITPRCRYVLNCAKIGLTLVNISEVLTFCQEGDMASEPTGVQQKARQVEMDKLEDFYL